MKSQKLKNWLLLVAIASVLVILDKQGYFNWLKRSVGQLVNPVKHRLYLNEVTEANSDQVESGRLAIVEAELVSKTEENERLRKLLETKLPPSWRFVPTNILGLSDETMTIDVGKAMEIDKGMVVMALVKEKINGGIVVGRIDKVDLMKSTVSLLTNKDMRVKVKTEAGVEGVVRNLKGELRLLEVLQVNTINPGELILSQGVDGWLPGLVIGRVGKVNKLDTEVYQTATVDLIIDISSLKQVFVVSL
jgi:cell shape-determining protein MreC